MTLNKLYHRCCKGKLDWNNGCRAYQSGLQVKHCLAILVLVPDERRGLRTKVAVGTGGNLGFGAKLGEWEEEDQDGIFRSVLVRTRSSDVILEFGYLPRKHEASKIDLLRNR